MIFLSLFEVVVVFFLFYTHAHADRMQTGRVLILPLSFFLSLALLLVSFLVFFLHLFVVVVVLLFALLVPRVVVDKILRKPRHGVGGLR